MGGRVEIITGPDRRRRWSDEEKLQLVEEACRPGMSVSLVARQRGINASQLFAWRRQALANGRVADNRCELGTAPALTFAPVEVAPDPAMADAGEQARPARRRRGIKASGAIEIELNSGDRVRVEGCIDASVVARIISALRRA
ncbi:MAG: IS66-like element accessory protein TnpA [Methyloceanibacter sp.]